MLDRSFLVIFLNVLDHDVRQIALLVGASIYCSSVRYCVLMNNETNNAALLIYHFWENIYRIVCRSRRRRCECLSTSSISHACTICIHCFLVCAMRAIMENLSPTRLFAKPRIFTNNSQSFIVDAIKTVKYYYYSIERNPNST